MNKSNTIQLLQVFNSGKPCGWLGQSTSGFWFHYASNNPQQHWVSLLMPPSTNFYQQAEMFPVFEQHADSYIDMLPHLQQSNGTQLGALSFANPDNPVVKAPLRALPPLQPGQQALVAQQTRKPFADTLVHHASTWPLVQILQEIKRQADPNNRLHALRWALQAEYTNNFLQHPRPDLDEYQQQLLGFEQAHSVLNLSSLQFSHLAQHGPRFFQVLQELVRTFCKNFTAEIALLQHMLPFIQTGQINVYVVYKPAKTSSIITAAISKPLVLGLQYLPSRIPHLPREQLTSRHSTLPSYGSVQQAISELVLR